MKLKFKLDTLEGLDAASQVSMSKALTARTTCLWTELWTNPNWMNSATTM